MRWDRQAEKPLQEWDTAEDIYLPACVWGCCGHENRSCSKTVDTLEMRHSTEEKMVWALGETKDQITYWRLQFPPNAVNQTHRWTVYCRCPDFLFLKKHFLIPFSVWIRGSVLRSASMGHFIVKNAPDFCIWLPVWLDCKWHGYC